MFRLPDFDENNKHIKPIAFWRIALRMHKSFDLLKRPTINVLAFDRSDFRSVRP
jgi:hypothetical protein